MTEDTVRIARPALTRFTREIFVAKGVAEADAETVAEVLVWANARGMDSHGVLRVPNYVRHIDNGESNPAPDMKIVTETPAACVVDADRALGPVGMRFAMERAIARWEGQPRFPAYKAPAAATPARRTGRTATGGQQGTAPPQDEVQRPRLF